MAKGLIQNKPRISIVGAAAVGDYLLYVDKLPQKGEVVQVKKYNDKIQFGGCAPNIAVGISKLGIAQPVLHYPVGDDYQTYLDEWEKNGVLCNISRGKGKSGVSWMFMQDDGVTMCFAWEGVANTLPWPDDAQLDEYVVVCPVLNDYTGGCLEQAIKERKKVFVSGIANSKLIPYLSRIYGLSLNEYEFRSLCASLHIEETEFCKKFPSLVLIVTMGGKGSRIQQGNNCYQIPVVVPNEIVDFTGAGDAYISGFLSSRFYGYDFECSGYVGAATSSFVLEHLGGQEGFPDWNQIMERIMKQYPAIGSRLREREG